MKINYKRNIYLIYFIFTLYAFAICWNVIQVLFFQANNLNFFQISTLLLTLSLVILLFEVPTGAFTDMFGRRLSLILFSITFGVSSFLFAVSSSFWAFMIAIFFLGVGFSFWSGTADSILYESLKGLGKKKLFTKYLSRMHFLFVGVGIAVFSDLMNQPLIINYFYLGTYGIIFASATIVQTVLLFYLARIIGMSRKSNPYFILMLVWSIGLILLLAFIENVYILVPIMGVLWLVGSFKTVLIEDELNQNLDDDSRRATILSINAMFSSLIFIIVLPVFGLISDVYSIEFGVYVISALSFVMGLILLYFKR